MTKNNLPCDINKYLTKYSFDNWILEHNSKKLFNIIVVIPALEEFEGINDLLKSLSKNDPLSLEQILFVFVVNNTASVTEEIKRNNKNSITLLHSLINLNSGNLLSSALNIGLVDASSPGKELPEKDGGVGLARKIGMDLSLRLFNFSNKKQNLLVCLDGDCTVSSNYAETLVSATNNLSLKAGHVKYEHLLPEETEYRLAIICYEIFLRYYVLGLSYANSPYAFHTIGSTMLCSAESYVKIQGMNKRKAAEDFYFMEKLSKISPIAILEDATVYPSNRPSWRVPFGTGQRVRRFINHEQNEYLLYSFKSFGILRQWLLVFMDEQATDPDYLLNQAAKISSCLHKFLTDQNFSSSWVKIIRDNKNTEQIQKQKRYWFDGFKTLKLIHYLRDEQFPDEPMFDVLDEAFKKRGLTLVQRNRSELIPPMEKQIEYLEILQHNY